MLALSISEPHADILRLMSKTAKESPKQQQKTSAMMQSRWFYILGIAAVVILLASFIPGGEALRFLLVPLFGWSSFIWMLRRYGFKKVFRAVFIGFLVMVFTGWIFLL